MHALSGLDQRILGKLAVEAGNVLERVEMIKSIEQRKKLEQELTLAEETQKSLLPQSLPQVQNLNIHAFSKPTRYVGGDFYDFRGTRIRRIVRCACRRVRKRDFGLLAQFDVAGLPANAVARRVLASRRR